MTFDEILGGVDRVLNSSLGKHIIEANSPKPPKQPAAPKPIVMNPAQPAANNMPLIIGGVAAVVVSIVLAMVLIRNKK